MHDFCDMFGHYFKLNVRGKNKKEKLGGLFKGLAKGVDEVLISGQKVNLELTYCKIPKISPGA